ncbi:MAG: aminotransferase class III-fold pyridoxal phosphate-dependent enzyme [Gammaproteobacteria bacterium]|nr:aminotransferase class III-fold pyridoxal phosphate-dependent enzyme [Gammaproteobacteria bacterium]
MVKGDGCYIFDEQGNRFLDAIAGLWCVNVGYGREELGDIARRQMAELNYLAPLMSSGPVIEFAEKLQQMLGFECHVYFSCSGSEANETAIKIARQYHLQSGRAGQMRYKIISRYRAYHGNTMAALAATGQAERKMGYEPGPTGFIHIMPPYPYRAHPKLTAEEHGEECARQLEETILHEGAETVAAFIMEPLLSGGGVLVPPDNYIPRVREICDRYGVLLIFDEVVSGFGRLGTMFGFEHWRTEADIYTFAKGLASGYVPVAATVAKKHVFDEFDGEPDETKHFRQINTYGGHPVSSAVAIAAIEIVEREDLASNAREVGGYMINELSRVLADHPFAGEVRGKGMIMGIELVENRASKEPLADEHVTAIVNDCVANGVVLGRNSNTIPGRCNVLLIAPPLILKRDEADMIVSTVDAAMRRVLNGRRSA